MLAAILEEINRPLSVEELYMPDLGWGQVLVRVMASGICGKQIGEISGHFGEDKYLPHLLGHEGGGIVWDIGTGVTKFTPGDHVVMHWRKGSGIESLPPTYLRRDDSKVGGGWVTTFNTYAVVSENRLTKINGDIPFDIAALMGCAVTTGLGIVSNEAKLKIGQSIAVFGSGGVGLNVIQGASMASAFPVIAIDRISAKLRWAAVNGATHVIHSEHDDVEKEIKTITGKGVDVFVDCTGNPDIISRMINMTRKGGKVILVGQPRFDSNILIKNFASIYDGKEIFSSQGGLTNPDEDIPRYLRLYEEGKLNLKNIISHRYGLKDINTAIEEIKAGERLRCIIDMEIV